MTDLLKAVYTTEKFGSGPLKKAVRTHNFCKEILEFPQGHEGRLQGRLHDREKNGTDPTKTGTVPIIFEKKQ